MVRIFTIEDKKLSINAEVLYIPEFKAIKDTFKEDAVNVFLFIFHMCDYSSPYFKSKDRESRQIALEKDFLQNVDYKNHLDIIKRAVGKYQELSSSPTLKLLEAAKSAVTKVSDYLNNNFPSDGNVKNYISALEKVGKIQAEISSLEEAVKTEQLNSKIRGGGEINKREKRIGER